MEIFFNQSRMQWEDALVFGNGSLGGMSKGEISKEVINLNDDRFWSGKEESSQTSRGKEYLPEIRLAIQNKDFRTAESLIEKHLLGHYTESYLVLGQLELTQNIKDTEAEEYRHSLDIENSLVQTSFKDTQATYQREAFASYPDQAVFFKRQQSHASDLTLNFKTPFKHQTKVENNTLVIEVEAPTHVVPSYIQSEDPVLYEGKGEIYSYRLEILDTDGQVSFNENGFHITQYTYLELAFCRNEVEVLPSYSQARNSHILDYHYLFQRVVLDLGPQINLPMDERLDRLRAGEEDPGLVALYFQFGRYLLISSSRPGSLAANLQGIWNWQVRPPWSSNYTSNINLEMNYWGADVANLSECFEPYVDLVKLVAEKGKETAQNFYGMRGTVAHHNVDRWGHTGPVGKQRQNDFGDEGAVTWAYWPMGSVWMANDLYRHYEFSRDSTYLEETVWPILKENVLFILDFLVEEDGVYHTIPSTSPENTYFDENDRQISVTFSSTMDLGLIHDLFKSFLSTSELLEMNNEPLIEKVKTVRSKLAPIPITEDGRLMEWQEDLPEAEEGHRHFSHLYGTYPSEVFGPEYDEAAIKAIEKRMAHGGGHTGWSNACLMNLYAVLGDGEKAYERIIHALTDASYDSLLSKHPPFQIDGNFGAIAGIANLFVQDRYGETKLLPALPKALANGYVKGLKVKGGEGIEIEWQEGMIVSS